MSADAHRDRFILLDLLRAIAALTVVLFHWQHMLYAPGQDSVSPLLRAFQPGFRTWFVLYEYGFRAVDLFFILSGFIFYRLYADKIANGRASAKTFALLRFSRLYPLHLLALLLVIQLQWLYFARNGAWFVYQHNDWWHLALQLLFVQNWGFERGDSFNGPEWSVSIEVLMYAVFFVLCRYRFSGVRSALVAVVLGLALYKISPMIGRGLIGFFLGGVVCFVFGWLQGPGLRWRRLVTWLSLLTVGIGFALVFALPGSLLDVQVISRISAIGASAEGHSKGRQVLAMLSVLVLFPATVLALALLEPLLGNKLARIGWLGNITYSSYLLHYPLQLAFLLVAAALGVTINPSSGLWLSAYGVMLISLSIACYYLFELPAQQWLRGASRRFTHVQPTSGQAASRQSLPSAESNPHRRQFPSAL